MTSETSVGVFTRCHYGCTMMVMMMLPSRSRTSITTTTMMMIVVNDDDEDDDDEDSFIKRQNTQGLVVLKQKLEQQKDRVNEINEIITSA